MENQKRKGRPPKEGRVVRRDHFSVWVTNDEKAKIKQLVEQTGLSASQFFLALALDVPFKRPKKRTLPKATTDTIRILQQLSGILSLAVLKTKDHQMVSAQWQQSSQQVRLLADLVTLWVFESFEIRSMEQTLAQLHSWLNELAALVSGFSDELESKSQLLDQCQSNARLVGDLLDRYEAYYLSPMLELEPAWKPVGADSTLVHQEIENALSMMLKKIKA